VAFLRLFSGFSLAVEGKSLKIRTGFCARKVSEVNMADVPKARAEAFAKRWRKIVTSTATLDYESAELASEVREFFPGGASGDFQFRSWCMSYLQIASSTAAKLLRAVTAIKKVPVKDTWIDLGGWMSITLVASLTAQERNRLLKACATKVRNLGRPISYSTVRQIAFGLGVRSRNPGRRNVWESEERLGHLQAWLDTLYSQYELPPMPTHISDAMQNTRLGTVQEAVRNVS
jgi:hypothetical protein